MFNETTAEEPIHLFANPCPAGQVQDYDPATRSFLPGCVDDTSAYRAGGYPTGPVAKAPATDNTWLWMAAGGVLALAILFSGGRR